MMKFNEMNTGLGNGVSLTNIVDTYCKEYIAIINIEGEIIFVVNAAKEYQTAINMNLVPPFSKGVDEIKHYDVYDVNGKLATTYQPNSNDMLKLDVLTQRPYTQLILNARMQQGNMPMPGLACSEFSGMARFGGFGPIVQPQMNPMGGGMSAPGFGFPNIPANPMMNGSNVGVMMRLDNMTGILSEILTCLKEKDKGPKLQSIFQPQPACRMMPKPKNMDGMKSDVNLFKCLQPNFNDYAKDNILKYVCVDMDVVKLVAEKKDYIHKYIGMHIDMLLNKDIPYHKEDIEPGLDIIFSTILNMAPICESLKSSLDKMSNNNDKIFALIQFLGKYAHENVSIDCYTISVLTALYIIDYLIANNLVSFIDHKIPYNSEQIKEDNKVAIINQTSDAFNLNLVGIIHVFTVVLSSKVGNELALGDLFPICLTSKGFRTEYNEI